MICRNGHVSLDLNSMPLYINHINCTVEYLKVNAFSQLGESEEKRIDGVVLQQWRPGFLISYINNVCNKSRSLNWFLWEFNSKSFDFTSSPHFGIRKFLEEEKYDAIRMKIYMPSNIVGCSKKVKSRQQNGKDKTLNLPYDVFCFLHSPQTILYLGFGHFVVSPVHYLFVWFRVWHFVVIFV